MLAMRELRQRRMDLNIKFAEFHAVWMLMKLRKRKKIESYELQALRNVVKENAADVVTRFENKFKETRIEGKRKFNGTTTAHYTESKHNEVETMYMGSESEARKRFCSYSQDRSQSRDKRQQSTTRGRYEPRKSYEE